MTDAYMIAALLQQLGLDAKCIEGWVYVRFPDGRVLNISADNGASLQANIYPTTPSWYEERVA